MLTLTALTTLISNMHNYHHWPTPCMGHGGCVRIMLLGSAMDVGWLCFFLFYQPMAFLLARLSFESILLCCNIPPKRGIAASKLTQLSLLS